MLIEGLEYTEEIGLSSRNRSILEALNHGVSTRAIAEEFGLTTSAVRSIAKVYSSHVSNYLTWRDKIREENLLSSRLFDNRPPLTKAVIRAYAGGSSYAEAAQEHGIDAEKVMKLISVFMTDAAQSRKRANNPAKIQRQKEEGERLQRLRISSGLSISQLAHELNVCPATVKRYESGESELKSSKLIWIADLFDVSMDYIVAEE